MRCNFITYLGIVAIAVGCSFKSPKKGAKNSNNQADFIIDNITLIPTGSVQQKLGKEFLRKKIYNLNYCFKDQKTAESLYDETFETKIFDFGATIKTDHKGCAVVNYSVTYNDYQSQIFVDIPYQMTRPQTGSLYEGRFALNPWKDTLVDLRYSTVPDLHPAESSNMGFQGLIADTKYDGDLSDLKIDWIDVITKDKNLSADPTFYNLNISFASQVLRLNADKRQEVIALDHGQFEIDVVLVATNDKKEKTIIASAEAPVSAIVLNQKLNFEDIKLLQFDQPSPNDDLEFFVQIKPANPELGISQWEGKTHFNNIVLEGTKGMSLNKLTTEETFDTYKIPLKNRQNHVSGPSIFVKDFSYEYPPQQVDASISKNMALTINEFLYVILTPVIFAPDEIGRSAFGNSQTVQPKEGSSFKVRMAILARDNLLPTPEGAAPDPYRSMRYISGIETIAKTNANGQLIIPVLYAFDFQERPRMEAGTHLLIELTPEFNYLDSSLKPAHTDVMFDFLTDSGSSKVIKADAFDDLADITKTLVPYPYKLTEQSISAVKKEEMGLTTNDTVVYKPRIKSELDPLAAYLDIMKTNSGLQYVDLDKMVGTDATTDLVSTIASMHKAKFDQNGVINGELFAKICPLFNSGRLWTDTDAASKCLSNPTNFMTVRPVYFIDEILSRPAKIAQDNADISIRAGLNVSASDVNTNSSGNGTSTRIGVDVSASVTASVGIEALGNGVKGSVSTSISTGTSYSVFNNASRSQNQGQSRDLGIGSSKGLTVEEHLYRFDSKGSQCIILEPTAEDRNTCFYDTGCKTNYKPVLACKKASFSIDESWFFIADNVVYRLATKRNNRELINRRWLTLIRGKNNFSAFAASLEQSVSPVYLQKMHIMDLRFNSLLKDFLANQFYRYGIFQDTGLGDFPGMVR